MTLGELIEALEKADQDAVLPLGFECPHSYRGDYSQLAFEPAENVRVGEMLACAREALGKTYTGWKGGDYEMHKYVDVYLADVGECGEELGRSLLQYMLRDSTKPEQER